MSTPQPPDPGKRDAPGQPGEGAGTDQPGSHRATPDQPTTQLPTGADDPARNPGADNPAEPAHAGFAAPAGPVGPTGSGGGTRWYRPRRSWPWVTAGIVVGLLLLVLAFGAGRVSGRFHDRAGFHERGDGHGHGRMYDGPRGAGPGMMGERWDGFGTGDGRGGRGDRGPGGAAVVGTVASVNGPTVVVNVDRGGPANVTTTDRTTVVGEQRHSVTDLKAGDRVIVRGRPGQPADAVLVPTARARGTVSSVTGDRATVTGPDGLAQVVDLSGVTTKPVQGDRIIARGTVTDNGATLKADSIRILPKN